MKRTILAFLCCIFAAIGSAQAGTTGNIIGTVTNEAGVPVADARVLIVSASDKEYAQTDPRGTFSFLRLPPDVYTIAMEKPGFDPVSYAGVTVFADNSLALKFRLQKHLVYHSGHGYAFRTELVKSGVGADEMNVAAYHYEAYSNGVPMMLTTVPGVQVGSGNAYIH